MSFNRRQLFTASAALTAAGAGILSALTHPATAEEKTRTGEKERAEEKAEEKVRREELEHTGPEGDVMLGSEKAPVTIIEYASMTCPHCAHFSATTFPELKKRYIETGKVRYALREFPLDALAAAGFMLGRCAGKEKYMPIMETLFAKQSEWIVKEPIPPLKSIAKQFGFTEAEFDKCLANQKVLDGIQHVRDHAVEKLGVNSTPTFFVNGKKLVGDQSMETLEKEIAAYLKE